MKHLRVILFFLLSFFVRTAADAAPISDFRFEGLKRIEADALLEKMTLKKGDEARADKVAENIKAIFALGFFEDVEVLQNSAGVLIVKLRERPVTTEIVYEGAEEFEVKDLEEATLLKPFNVIGIDRIKKASDAILKKYEEKGYYLARVDHKIEPSKAGRSSEVKLVFTIQENPKVWIRKIFFQGNKVFPSDALKRIMITAEGHAMSWASGGGTFREAAFERDLAALAYYYGNEGYIEATFGKPRVTLSQDRRYIDIIIDVNEGKKYQLDSVGFSGDDLFSEAELRKAFAMNDDDVFSTGKLQESILALTDKFGDEGYAFANVIPKTKILPESERVGLQISIERGEKVYWGKIVTTGNKTTHDKVLRRELQFAEGDLYNATKRRKSLERIRRLGFFGQDVNFVTSAPEGSANSMDLEIRVTEKPAGTLMVQAGFGSGAGFSFGANVSHANLFGLGQQLAFNVNFSTKSSKTFNFQFTDPKVFDSEWLAGFDAYITENNVGGVPRTYRQKLQGGALRTGREIAEDITLYGTYKLEHYELSEVISEDLLTDNVKDRKAFASSITSTISYDRRNNRLDPSGGIFLTGSAEFAGLGGRVFQKLLVNARWYRRIVGSLVYRSNYEFGILTNFMTGETVPDNERYVLGGIMSLRGYPIATVGPSRRVVNTYDKKADGTLAYPNPFNYPIGGTRKLVMNQELEFPLIPEADIRIVLFFDAGNSWNGNLLNESPALLADYGWGIRWYSPMGPLRFEFGYPLITTPSKPNRGVEFNFIIAPTF